MSQKRMGLFLTIFVAVLAVMMLVPKDLHLRGPASLNDDHVALAQEAIQIKTQMIQDIRWVQNGAFMQFEIVSADAAFCDKWSDVSLTLMADNVAVSGTVPQATMRSACHNNKFEVLWPLDTALWPQQTLMVGDFSVEPDLFFIGTIQISGPLGEMKILSAEIETVLNRRFELELQ